MKSFTVIFDEQELTYEQMMHALERIKKDTKVIICDMNKEEKES